MSSFKYLYEMQATGELDVEDIGNCAIVGTNSLQYQRYILIVKTVEGDTKVVISGPHWVELELPCVDYSYTYQNFQFNQRKIETIIDKFLNGKFFIDQARVVEFDEAVKLIPDVREYITNDETRKD